ncbi:MAG: Dyp-type peroxidase [Chloroflexota bacterium]|nr:Dyp-type peroxidase [Chloroflexota bacterium]
MTLTSFAHGILPDDVITDPTSEASLIFVTLASSLDHAGVLSWLQAATGLVTALEAPVNGTRLATAAVAFGPSFFTAGTTARFDLQGRAPREFGDLPTVPTAAAIVAADVVFYVLSRSRAQVVDFVLGLWGSRTAGLASIAIENGFQRGNGRELFGFRDGMRNIPAEDRPRVVFVGPDAADEPDSSENGSYMAYLKLPQDLDAWNRLSADEQERRMGRRRADGSRLDLPAGSDPRAEGAYASDDSPAPAAHVRKVRPQGGLTSQIFRRGVPFLQVDGGAVTAGLQFVSFQASLDDFDAMLQRWMLAKDFKTAGAGIDLLFADGVVRIDKVGFFFAPPADPRFIGARFFDTPQRRRGVGRVFIRKKLVDANGSKVAGQLDGAVFQMLRKDSGAPLGAPFTTESSGHALSPEVPIGVPLLVHEVQPLAGATASADSDITLDGPRGFVEVRNVIPQPNPAPSPYRG